MQIHQTKVFDSCYTSGIPLVYELDENLQPVKHFYLASEEEVKAAMDRVANQGKAKWKSFTTQC